MSESNIHRLIVLQIRRVNYMLSHLKLAQMEVVKLEDAVLTKAEDEQETFIRITTSIRELELMRHDLNLLRRRLIQR